MRAVATVAIGLIAALLMPSPASAGGAPLPSRTDKDYDFDGKIIYVVSKPKDAKSDSTYGLYERVKIVRLGDREFLVGQVPDYGEKGEAYKVMAGKRVWTPVSDIVQMTEFGTLDEAKRFFTSEREGEKHDR